MSHRSRRRDPAALSLALMALVLGACSATPSPDAGMSPTPSVPSEQPSTRLSPQTVAYLKAWAANDVPTMVMNSAPGSPARGYAHYWGRVFESGRQDTGSAELSVNERSAVLTYPGGSYRLTDLDADDSGLRTWTSRPGGPLDDRIVAGRPTRVSVGGLDVTVHEQYVNTEKDLRITVTVRRSPSAVAAALASPRYTTPAGGRSRASMGSQGRTGVVPLPIGETVALVSVPRAAQGGRLSLVAYQGNGRRLASAQVDLPG